MQLNKKLSLSKNIRLADKQKDLDTRSANFEE
jgi:hypothetical protein